MLLTITTTHRPATDLGFLLHKNPARLQTFKLSFGKAHVFYPEATEAKCTAALLMEFDTVSLVRKQDRSAALEQYVNDRPYVASSFLSVALSEVLGTALNGHCKVKPELVEEKLPLSAHLPVVVCRGGEQFLRLLFEPLGYQVTATQLLLDEQYPEWGMSPSFSVTLEATCRLQDLLSHLYVLIPVLDNDQHYWVGENEVEKLLRHGKGWLESHPAFEVITRRYLKNKHSLIRDAIRQLITVDETAEPEAEEEEQEKKEDEKQVSLHAERLNTVLEVLKQHKVQRVLDLGCGEGKLLKLLLQDQSFKEIVGMDVSYRSLEIAQSRLKLDTLHPKQRERIKLIHGALTYRDKRLEGYDAAAVVEVIEHLDPQRLSAFERVLFEHAHPTLVVMTTPNAEYNVKYPTLTVGTFRHKDHRFEWTREEFKSWGQRVATKFGYMVEFSQLGTEDPVVGGPSQMAVFQVG